VQRNLNDAIVLVYYNGLCNSLQHVAPIATKYGCITSKLSCGNMWGLLRSGAPPFDPRSGAPPFDLRSGAPPFDLRSGAPPFDLRSGAPPFDLRSGAPPFDPRSGALHFDLRSGALPFNLRSGALPFDLQSGVPPFDSRSGAPPFDSRSGAPPFDHAIQQRPTILYVFYRGQSIEELHRSTYKKQTHIYTGDQFRTLKHPDSLADDHSR
jgi:hypothetical protein